jgi:hypothetical protein
MSRSLESFAEIGKELKFINENELFLARYSHLHGVCPH